MFESCQNFNVNFPTPLGSCSTSDKDQVKPAGKDYVKASVTIVYMCCDNVTIRKNTKFIYIYWILG